MGLVEYPDSSTDSEAEELLQPKKKQRTNSHAVRSLPELPTAFHDLYASSIRVSVRDDPNLHGGRKRVIPHVEGNWPTHIYLEWYPRKDELIILEDILKKCETELAHGHSKIDTLLQSDLNVQLPLHVSLSRPVVLSTDQKQPFIEGFEHAIKESNTKPFTVISDTLDWVSNTERTRWFLVIRLKKPKDDNLNQLLRISNRILAVYNQPPLYATEVKLMDRVIKHGKSSSRLTENEDFTDCFHISIAWSLTAPSSEERQKASDINLDTLRLEISFNSVKAKIGNVSRPPHIIIAFQPPVTTTSFQPQGYTETTSYNWQVFFSQHDQLSDSNCHTDLQKFHANHFFGASGRHDAFQSDLADNEVEWLCQDNDLGYYADGAKRTLTDEQIEIFRHSEIHALLRERERLREEEAEEERDGEEIKHNNSKSVKISKDDGKFDGKSTQDEPTNGALKRKSAEDNEDFSAKRAKDEDGGAAKLRQPQQLAFSRDLNSGRKIVSYADD
ncbi:conserved hypothetical protein [Talaromyces stipitatus ATCC 10500]|uniref:U6 snRNA phosphodiesterase n=1 Tax=Talaromyces stipitatus (strain ATCC 10500 / CBS 375.48 / QM 6759 / NRRL 1006) TaxID=441959 RepID=B8MGA0_TALSN|nr:uncharacterized protein TSTA_013250 [Talaromyces stipitatus ATCC 10500]XP_002483455.1 uncharacterized protein TSTA_013250 [Talaromyces stipitatus ATCC 10500]EED16220.1 conserved hypothetical protein [Talaromyces stipitatus ATCC 10500]EED16221.1 conserved hypothetical protein [Talaromyces stipitatus ATCC 10500]